MAGPALNCTLLSTLGVLRMSNTCNTDVHDPLSVNEGDWRVITFRAYVAGGSVAALMPTWQMLTCKH